MYKMGRMLLICWQVCRKLSNCEMILKISFSQRYCHLLTFFFFFFPLNKLGKHFSLPWRLIFYGKDCNCKQVSRLQADFPEIRSIDEVPALSVGCCSAHHFHSESYLHSKPQGSAASKSIVELLGYDRFCTRMIKEKELHWRVNLLASTPGYVRAAMCMWAVAAKELMPHRIIYWFSHSRLFLLTAAIDGSVHHRSRPA